MTVRFEHVEIETLLDELEVMTGKERETLLLEALRRERHRARAIAEGLAADDSLRRSWTSRPAIDPQPADAILSYDEHGLPV